MKPGPSADTSTVPSASSDGASAAPSTRSSAGWWSDTASWWRRPVVLATGLLAFLAFVPALTSVPGRMPADSKLYLYLDPGRFLADAAGSFDPRQFGGWVPHQHIAYLWPSGPWFWAFELVGVPDWVAHRLWVGAIMLAAGLGARWCARQLGLAPAAALVAAVVYQVSPYVLPYVSRTSVMLLPWAGLGWIVALTARSCRTRGWRDPAMIALIVLTVGAVNATALMMIVPAPALWLIHAAWARLITVRDALMVAVRTGVLSVAVSCWWIVGLVVQGRFGADVLRYSESLADVSLTATSAEVWRGLGYWLFYLRDPFVATTTESLRYLASTPAIAVSFLVPIACLAGLAWTRWIHRRFAILSVGVGVLLAIGVHPSDDRAPLVDALSGGGDSGVALALRSSTRALPVMNLGLALGAGALVASLGSSSGPRRFGERLAAVAVVAVVLANMPGLWTGAFVDPALERDQDPPAAWTAAAAALDGASSERVVMLPGTEFGAYRWGYTVDQPLPGLSEVDVVTRDLLPLGSAAAMDLWYAFDDRFQDGVADPASVADTARLFAADTVWLTNDLADDRFATARPEIVRDVVLESGSVDRVDTFGPAVANERVFAPIDGRTLTDARVGAPLPPVELVRLDVDAALARSYASTLLLVGSGDGVVDAAAAGLLSRDVGVLYAADAPNPRPSEIGVVVTDSNRDRDRHWRSSQDTTGYTEAGGTGIAVSGGGSLDSRLPVFEADDASTRTIAVQTGPVTAMASAYGQPFAFTPEDRAVMAIDGDPDTAWAVGEHADPIGATIELAFPMGSPTGTLVVHQSGRQSDRRITSIELTEGASDGWRTESARTIALDPSTPDGDTVELAVDTTAIRLEITGVGGGVAGTASAVVEVGFTELDVGLEPTVEVVRPPLPPTDVPDDLPSALVLTRLRVDPMDPWRSDPEPTIVRQLTLTTDRTFEPAYAVRVDGRASDRELADLLGWPVTASTRLTGSLRSAGVAAFDQDSSTAWVTAFGAARGAVLTIPDHRRPIATIEVDQPVDDTSIVRELTLRSGDEERVVALEPGPSGSARATVSPPLPAGPVEITITEIDAATTVDRRFGDLVELPAAIAEVRFEGAPSTAPLGTQSTTIDCVTLARLDGDELEASITIEGERWLDGGTVTAEPCELSLELGAGDHLLSGVDGVLQLDRVVFDDRLRTTLGDVDDRPATIELDRDRFGGRYEVAGCPTGCWFTFGEGFNTAWSASIDGTDLGPPTVIDGGFNGWWVAPTEEPFEVDVSWSAQRAQTAALILSGLAALGCIALCLRARGDSGPPPSARIVAAMSRPRLDRRTAVVAGAGWAVAGLLLVGPEGLAFGTLAGGALVLTRRREIPALLTIATVATIGAYVVANERRWSPLPNGGWPIQFERVHELGAFAAVSLLVAGVLVDDGRRTPAPRAGGDEPAGDERLQLPSRP